MRGNNSVILAMDDFQEDFTYEPHCSDPTVPVHPVNSIGLESREKVGVTEGSEEARETQLSQEARQGI